LKKKLKKPKPPANPQVKPPQKELPKKVKFFSKNNFLEVQPVIKKGKVKKTEYFFSVGAFSNDDDKLFEMYNEMRKIKKEDSLKVFIASVGGKVTECQILINTIGKDSGIKTKDVEAYIVSHASSAGAYSFISFENRIIYPNSRIMFHHASGGTFGTMKKMKDKIDFDLEHLEDFLGSAKKYFTKKEWRKLQDGKDFWWDAEEMLKRGIATEIIINSKRFNPQEGLKELKRLKKSQNNTFLKGK